MKIKNKINQDKLVKNKYIGRQYHMMHRKYIINKTIKLKKYKQNTIKEEQSTKLEKQKVIVVIVYEQHSEKW